VFIIGCSNNGVNRVVICSFSKDYEFMSWNEQGEITYFEGMLTICFLVVSPCFHIDNWKQLYLIIKIPYMVNMSDCMSEDGLVINDIVVKKEITAEEEIELLKRAIIDSFDGEEYKLFHPHHEKIFDTYKENIDKVKKLEIRVKNLERENKELKDKIEALEKKLDEMDKIKKENLRLKIISGEAKSGWIQERDLLRRPHPITGETDGHRCPFDFNFNLVEYLNIYFNYEKKEQWCNFWHPYPKSGSSTKKFDMPHTGYLFLKGELPEQKKDKPKKFDSIEIKKYDDLTKHIELFGFSEYSYRKLENVFEFLKEHKGKTFSRQYFTGNCDISPRTVSKYLKMLEECKLIIKLPSKGKHKVNIK